MPKLNFMIHCGGSVVERDAIMDLSPPQPATDTHFPIAHSKLVEMLLNRLPEYGLNVVQEAHAISHEDNRYFGMFQIQNGEADTDFAMVVGLRNSHDRAFRAGLTLGNGVFVCDNLCFNGEVVVGRRHTKNVLTDLPNLMNTAVGRVLESRIVQQQRIENYKTTELSPAEADHLIIKAWEAGAIKPTRIPKVVKEYKAIRHPEFAERTVWSLLNAFTELYKQNQVMDLPTLNTKLHGVLDSHCGVVVDAKQAIADEFADNDDVTVE